MGLLGHKWNPFGVLPHWGSGLAVPLHPKALGRAAAFAGSWDRPCNGHRAPAASALQQQNTQSSCERENQAQKPAPVWPQNVVEQNKGRM